MKLCSAKSLAGRSIAQLRASVAANKLRPLLAIALCVLFLGQAHAQPARPAATQAQPPADLPKELVTARDRMTLERPGAPGFFLAVEFESTSDTGVVSRGTVTSDWWNPQWWRQRVVLNGKSRDTVAIAGKIYRDESDGFLVPLRVQALMSAVWRAVPETPQHKAEEHDLVLEGTALHCLTLPTAAEAPDLKPSAKTFCLDKLGNLRITADPIFRVLYNSYRPIDRSRQIPWSVQMLRGTSLVASLHVVQFGERTDGPRELQHMSTDDQIRFALADPREIVRLPPVLMQRQFLSIDVRMMPRGDALPHPGQRYAIVRVVEADGKLLDAEVLSASDGAARLLAIQVLRTASFRIPSGNNPPGCTGTLLMVVP